VVTRLRFILVLIALWISTAIGWSDYYLADGVKVAYILGPGTVADEDVWGTTFPLGLEDEAERPILKEPQLPQNTVDWLRGLSDNDVALLYIMQGPEDMSFVEFPVEELAAITNDVDCRFLMVVLDLPASPDEPSLQDFLTQRRRAELFDRHTIVMASRPYGARNWATRPTGAGVKDAAGRGRWALQSDYVGLSMFGAYLNAALDGHADADLDGRVTAGEAFDYAFWCTWVDREPAGLLPGRLGRQTPSVRPGEGWEDVVLTEGTLWGSPDPFTIIVAHYTTRRWTPPLGPFGPAGPAGSSPAPTLPVGEPSEEAGGLDAWMWANMAAVEERIEALRERYETLGPLDENRPPVMQAPPGRLPGEGPVFLWGTERGPAGPEGMLLQPPRADFMDRVVSHPDAVGHEAAARENAERLLGLAAQVRRHETAAEDLARNLQYYYERKAVSISPEYIVPTDWPENLPPPLGGRGPAGPAGAHEPKEGTLPTPGRVEPVWSDKTTERLEALKAMVE